MQPKAFSWTVIQLMLTTALLAGVASATVSAIEVTRVVGDVEVKPEGASSFGKVSNRQQLKRRDLLKTASGALAVISCSKVLSREVRTQGRARSVSYYCPSEPKRERSGIIPPPVPGGIDSLIPYIISPRYTLLRNPQPTLRWNAVGGVTSYKVQLYQVELQKDVLIWETQVSGTEVVYPGQIPLEPDVDYFLVVAANNGRSSAEEAVTLGYYDPQERGVSGLKFRLLGQNEVQQVQAATVEIAQLDLSEEEKAIALAYEYAENKLFAEAIETLEGWVARGTSKSLVYRTLGDFYGATGLNRLAEERYVKAIALAATKQDAWERVTTQVNLGKLYVVMKKNNDALRLFQEAQVGYQRLGAMELAQQLEEPITDLSRIQ